MSKVCIRIFLTASMVFLGEHTARLGLRGQWLRAQANTAYLVLLDAVVIFGYFEVCSEVLSLHVCLSQRKIFFPKWPSRRVKSSF